MNCITLFLFIIGFASGFDLSVKEEEQLGGPEAVTGIRAQFNKFKTDFGRCSFHIRFIGFSS